MKTCINTQTRIHAFPRNYSQTQAFCPDVDTHTHTQSPSFNSSAPREHNEGSGGSAGCLLWAVAMQMLPGGSTLFLCVCFRASCDGQLPTHTKALATPQMVDPYRHGKRGEERAHTHSL